MVERPTTERPVSNCDLHLAKAGPEMPNECREVEGDLSSNRVKKS